MAISKEELDHAIDVMAQAVCDKLIADGLTTTSDGSGQLAALPGGWRPSYPGELGPMPIVELDEHGHYRTDPYSACSVCGREVGGAATITVDGKLRQLILPCRHVAQMLPSD